MDYKIRPAHPQDAGAMNALRTNLEVSSTLLSLPTERVESTVAFLSNLPPSSHQFVAVEVDSGKLLGSAGLMQRSHGRCAHVGDVGIMIVPEAQGQGIGRALMNTLVDLADNWLLLDRLALTVFAKNERAHNLYLSLGFEDEARLEKACVTGGLYEAEIAMGRLRPGFVPPPPKPFSPPEAPKRAPIPFSIRPLRREDCASVAHNQVLPGLFEYLDTLPSETLPAMEKWYDALNPYCDFLLAAVAENQGEENVLGVANMEISLNPRLRHLGNLGLGVAPAYQGMGIGRALLEAIIDTADNWMALERLQLTVLEGNHRAHPLYRSLGFHEEGRYQAASTFAGGYADEIVMARLR